MQAGLSMLQAMEAAQDADDKAQTTERKAKAAAAATPSKRARDEALRTANYSALVSLADEVPSIAAAASGQHGMSSGASTQAAAPPQADQLLQGGLAHHSCGASPIGALGVDSRALTAPLQTPQQQQQELRHGSLEQQQSAGHQDSALPAGHSSAKVPLPSLPLVSNAIPAAAQLALNCHSLGHRPNHAAGNWPQVCACHWDHQDAALRT